MQRSIWAVLVTVGLILAMNQPSDASSLSQAATPSATEHDVLIKEIVVNNPGDILGYNNQEYQLQETDVSIGQWYPVYSVDYSAIVEGLGTGDLAAYFPIMEDYWIAPLYFESEVRAAVMASRDGGILSPPQFFDGSTGAGLSGIQSGDKAFYHPELPGWFILRGQNVYRLDGTATREMSTNPMTLEEFQDWANQFAIPDMDDAEHPMAGSGGGSEIDPAQPRVLSSGVLTLGGGALAIVIIWYIRRRRLIS